MLRPKYDNRLDGVGDGAKAGAANGKIVICKHDSKLKRPNNPYETSTSFLGWKGKRTSAPVLCKQNARFWTNGKTIKCR